MGTDDPLIQALTDRAVYEHPTTEIAVLQVSLAWLAGALHRAGFALHGLWAERDNSSGSREDTMSVWLRHMLPHVQAPTLLIVGTRDPTILELNQAAYDALLAPKHLAIVPGATHDCAEPEALQDVAHLAAQWFRRYLDTEGL